MISLLQMEVESSVQPEIWQRFQDLQQFDVFYTPPGPFCWSLHVICWKPSEVSKQLHLLSTENRATTWSCVGLSNNCTCFQSTDVPSLGSLSFTFQASGRLLLAQNHQNFHIVNSSPVFVIFMAAATTWKVSRDRANLRSESLAKGEIQPDVCHFPEKQSLTKRSSLRAGFSWTKMALYVTRAPETVYQNSVVKYTVQSISIQLSIPVVFWFQYRLYKTGKRQRR